VTNYLDYGARRTGQYLRSGLAGQLVAGALAIAAWHYMADHETEVKRYAGAAVPKILISKVRTGGRVTAEVSPGAVRFVETPAGAHTHVLLGTFPRGLGFAHLGTATAIGQRLLHWIVPWLPLALLAWVLVAAVRTVLSRRLLPSASEYKMQGRTRAMGQVLVRIIGHPRRVVVWTVDGTDAGRTLAEWARRQGNVVTGTPGVDALDHLLAANRTRSQPTFGSIMDAQTRLRTGWELLCSSESDRLSRAAEPDAQ
jgi:hypothetical protein